MKQILAIIFVICACFSASCQNWIYSAGNRVESEVFIYSQDFGLVYINSRQFGSKASLTPLYSCEQNDTLIFESSNIVPLNYKVEYLVSSGDDSLQIFLGGTSIALFDKGRTTVNNFGISIQDSLSMYLLKVSSLTNRQINIDKREGFSIRLSICEEPVEGLEDYHLLRSFELKFQNVTNSEFISNPKPFLKEYLQDYEEHSFQEFNSLKALKSYYGKQLFDEIEIIYKHIKSRV